MNTQNDPLFSLAVVTAATWVVTVAMLAWLVLSLARLFVRRARPDDLPLIVAGLVIIIERLSSWMPTRGTPSTSGRPALPVEQESDDEGNVAP